VKNLLKIFRILQSKNGNFYAYLILLGVINSITQSGLLFIINETIIGKYPFIGQGYKAAAFFGLVVLSFLACRAFQNYLIRTTQQIIYHFEVALVDEVRRGSLQSFEQLATGEIYSAISDIRILAQFPEYLILFVNAVVFVLCGTAYLVWTSAPGGLLTIGCMVVLFKIYLVRNKRIMADLNEVRNLQDDYYSYLSDLLAGFKQIKLSGDKSNNIFQKHIVRNRASSLRLGSRAASGYAGNELIGTYSWYLLIGLILFGMTKFLGLSNTQEITFLVTVLYLMAPVANIVIFIQHYGLVAIALERILGLQDKVGVAKAGDEPVEDRVPAASGLKSIRFHQVGYSYNVQNGEAFVLGPIDLRINKGEILFLTGANGSGKSTVLKLLCGLYTPHSGEIYINDQLLAGSRLQEYRNTISAVFSDNVLFTRNYLSREFRHSREQLSAYLELLQLTDKVNIQFDKDQLADTLSSGQKRRVALSLALLEENDLLVLDEFAAEQDPQFKKEFYHKILPYIRDMGKTIVAVTHDDRYFGLADRVLKLEDGTITGGFSAGLVPDAANGVNLFQR